MALRPINAASMTNVGRVRGPDDHSSSSGAVPVGGMATLAWPCYPIEVRTCSRKRVHATRAGDENPTYRVCAGNAPSSGAIGRVPSSIPKYEGRKERGDCCERVPGR